MCSVKLFMSSDDLFRRQVLEARNAASSRFGRPSATVPPAWSWFILGLAVFFAALLLFATYVERTSNFTAGYAHNRDYGKYAAYGAACMWVARSCFSCQGLNFYPSPSLHKRDLCNIPWLCKNTLLRAGTSLLLVFRA